MSQLFTKLALAGAILMAVQPAIHADWKARAAQWLGRGTQLMILPYMTKALMWMYAKSSPPLDYLKGYGLFVLGDKIANWGDRRERQERRQEWWRNYRFHEEVQRLKNIEHDPQQVHRRVGA